MKNLTVSLSVLLLTTVAHAERPDARSVRIVDVKHQGDGCPKDGAVVALSPDASAFTVLFDGFVVDAAGDDARRCRLHVKLSVPRGWSYALDRVDFRGFAALEPGARMLRRSTYHLSGEGPPRTVSFELDGEQMEDYVAADALGLSSRCGGGKNLTITTELALEGQPGAQGAATIDSVDGEVVHLAWRRCR